MPRSPKTPETQARAACQQISEHQQKTTGKSLWAGSAGTYKDAFTEAAKFMRATYNETLRGMTVERAQDYLSNRAEAVKQATLNRDRLGLNMLLHAQNKLPPGQNLPYAKSELPSIIAARAYDPKYVPKIAEHQAPHNALSTLIAHAAGLRAHELLTLCRTGDDPRMIPTYRPEKTTLDIDSRKWAGRSGEQYIVKGKGGYVRAVLIPAHLARQLEARRLDQPRFVTDRHEGITYKQRYDIGGGKRWAKSFTEASRRALGYSDGAHGLRHSFAQERMRELQVREKTVYETALCVVSQELGHFRPSITLRYLV